MLALRQMYFSCFGLSSVETLFLFWMISVSVIALIVMGIDKASARLRKSRINENTFALLSLFGGFGGVILGGILFHHKTSKPRFWAPVLLSVVLWILVYYLVTVKV